MDAGGILDDDAPKRDQRLVLIIFAAAFILPSFIYVGIGFVKKMRSGKSKAASIVFCYVFIELGFIMRILYCLNWEKIRWPAMVYGIWSNYPALCTTTAALLFLIALLNSLDELYQTMKAERYGKLRYIIIALIVYFWLVFSFAYGLTAYCELVKKIETSIWPRVMFYVGILFHLIAGVFLSIISIKYLIEIEKLGEISEKNKVALYLLIVTTCLQILLRIFQGVLNATEFMLEWQIEKNIWFTVYTVSYFLLSDLLPSICYAYFMSIDCESSNILVPGKENINSTLKDGKVDALLKDLYDEKAKRDEHPGGDNGMNPSVLSSFNH
eukprot:TRINITY_DN3506_c0_g1_i7.p1 TRINITY_DN3506_c0_g1~~TRINITY_DN3506_c0_g1_i7.p1  ORF type:complete len:348 (-),score=50.07 TRINITY_DN3506_c0_g1_i7:68-1045(-)